MSSSSSPQLPIAERLSKLVRLWRKAANQALLPLNLTQSQWLVLWKMNHLGQGVSQKALAEALGIELASLMRTLGQLEQQQMLERRPCPSDKRVRLVYFTKQGVALLSKMEAIIVDVRQQILAGIDAEQLAQFEATLNKMSDNAHRLHSQ